MSYGDPSLPRQTCPTIDKAIALIEEVRVANAELRICAEFYQEKSEGLEDQVSKLENQVSELKSNLADEINARELMELKVAK